MSQQDDLLRALEYGKTEYFNAIRETQGYKTFLKKVQSDFNGRSWIESPFKFPKFDTEAFKKARQKYQEKYGTTVNIPGFGDILHLRLPIKITAEEMAAHRFAISRKLPSPLTPEQLESLRGRKYRFLKALASPTPDWLKAAGAVATFLDNAEDALVTAVVLGRTAASAFPRLFGPLIPGLGWVLWGADILNTVNMFSLLGYASMGKKRIVEDIASKNPFHVKAKAARALKLKRAFPTVGEFLEIGQTTDQMFGVGVCLGGIIGMVQEVLALEFVSRGRIGVQILETIRKPTEIERIWGKTLTNVLAIGPQGFYSDPETMAKIMLSLNGAITGLWNWWVENDPMSKITGLNNVKLKYPTIDDPINIDLQRDLGKSLRKDPLWETLGKPEATFEELYYSMSSKISDYAKAALIGHPTSWMAYTAGQQMVQYTKTIIAAFSDDNKATIGRTPYAAAAVEMSRETLMIPPNTPQDRIDMLAGWIRDYDRKHGESPRASEIRKAGQMLGIKFTDTFPKETLLSEVRFLPQWQRLQGQLKTYFTPN